MRGSGDGGAARQKTLERACQCGAVSALAQLTGEYTSEGLASTDQAARVGGAESEAVVTLLCATPAMCRRPRWRAPGNGATLLVCPKS